jgi:cytidylate kinase
MYTSTEGAIDILSSVVSVIYRQMAREEGMSVEDFLYQAERIMRAAELVGKAAVKNVRVTGADID